MNDTRFLLWIIGQMIISFTERKNRFGRKICVEVIVIAMKESVLKQILSSFSYVFRNT